MPEGDHDHHTDEDELNPTDETGYPVILHCYSAYRDQILKRREAVEEKPDNKLGPYGDWPVHGH